MDLLDIGKTPISDESPAGKDIRGGEQYEQLSIEIEKLSSPSASGIINWNKVLDISANILKNQSKDLLVCSYLSVALIKTQGLKGFALSVHIYLDCITLFWDGLFPPKARMRGRKNAIDWWVEAASNALENIKTTEEWKKEEIENLFNDIDAMERFLRENMDDPPSLRPMITIAASHLKEIPDKETSETKVSAEEEPEKQGREEATTAQPASRVTVSKTKIAESDPDKILRHGLKECREASTRFMDINPLDPLYFRLNRIVAWTAVTELPPSDDRGKTMIPPPDEQIVNSLKSLYRSRKWSDLLDSSESRITEYLFWLDLSRYTAESLEKLHEKKTSEEVAGETILFVRRLNGIETLTFSNGMPFVDGDTISWLQSLDTKKETQPVFYAGDSELTQEINEQLANAEVLAKEDKVSEAIKALYEHIKSARSGRDRFIWQIWFCRFLVKIKQIQLSISHAKRLLEWIERYGIEEWDPMLAAEGLSTVLFCMKNQNLVEKDEIFYNNILNRLEFIDPSRAMEFQPIR